MEKQNGVLGLQSLYQRFGNSTTFQQYWDTKCWVAHDERKVPYIGDVEHLDQLKYASATNPSTWRNAYEVFAALEADDTDTLVGIGYVLHGDGTVCIDLDKVVDDDGNISPEAQRILDRFPDTYAEYSLSGRGIHIWLRTSRPLPVDGRRTNGIEIYQNKRYIALTMDILPNRPDCITDYTDELHALYQELFGNEPDTPIDPDDEMYEDELDDETYEIEPETPSKPDDETYQLSDTELNSLTIRAVDTDGLDDEELIALFLQEPDNATVWYGDKLPHHPSLSEADCSLAVRLLWYTNGDTQRAHRLFCKSKRVLRDKVRPRPDLVDRAINAAYRYYLIKKRQREYIKQTANTADWDITQQYPCAEAIGTHDYSAKVCAAAMWGEILYLPKRDGWMVYNRNTGLWDNSDAQLYQRVKSILEHHYYHLSLSKTINDKELDRILTRIHHGDAVKKVIERLEMNPDLHSDPEKFNANPMLIPLRNGVYDLDIEPDKVDPESLRKKFRAYRPDDYITHTFDANYDPNAPGDHWIRAIEQWCCDPDFHIPDDELIEYLWYAIGYTFTGSIDEQAMFIVHGPGGNGKSTLVGTIARMMRNYSTTMLQNLFTVDKNTSAEPARQLEPLRNKRMVLHPELPNKTKLDSAKIKRIVSNEELSTRRLYEEEKDVYPTWKIWCTANEIPEIQDQAAWRRIRIIPFRTVFTTGMKTLYPTGELDPQLPKKLWEQRDYLATQGCHYAALWVKRTELPYCTAVAQATEEHHRASDPFEDWFNTCVEIDASGVVTNEEAYEHYKKYMDIIDQTPLTMKVWGQRMGQKRVPVVQKTHGGKRTRCRTGIKLLPHNN